MIKPGDLVELKDISDDIFEVLYISKVDNTYMVDCIDNSYTIVKSIDDIILATDKAIIKYLNKQLEMRIK